MTATFKLDIIIIGAGLAGIAAAFRLSQAGHHVRVLDEHDSGERGCTAAHLPPNATRILTDWGFQDRIQSLGHLIKNSRFYSMENGEFIGCQKWREEVIREIGADYYFMHYQDLYAMLYGAAVKAGAIVCFNTGVVNVEMDPPRVTLSNQSVLRADLVIGADGPRSITRRTLFGEERMKLEGHSLFTAVVPRKLVEDDASLGNLINPSLLEFPLWLGSSRHGEAMLMRDGTEFALNIFYPDSEIPIDAEDTWEGKAAQGWRPRSNDPVMQRLIDLCPDMRRLKLFVREELEDWIDESSRLLLIGNAAHPVLPCWSQSCAINLEDAEILGVLLSHINDIDQLPVLIEGFQELRMPKYRFIQDKSWWQSVQSMWLPPGPEQKARDEMLRRLQNDEDWDESMLQQQFDGLWAAFGYNAREAAEDWWATWGMLRERSKGTIGSFAPFHGTGA